MKDAYSQRRLAENEVVFRQANEKAQKDFDKLKAMAKSEGYGAMAKGRDIPLHFYCECSDENCRQRIVLTPSQYKSLHQNSSQFVLIPGHQVPELERVMTSKAEYVVVEKFYTPPPDADTLHPTNLQNT